MGTVTMKPTPLCSGIPGLMGLCNGLKERPLKGPLGFYRGFLRLHKVHKGYVRVLGLGLRSPKPLNP